MEAASGDSHVSAFGFFCLEPDDAPAIRNDTFGDDSMDTHQKQPWSHEPWKAHALERGQSAESRSTSRSTSYTDMTDRPGSTGSFGRVGSDSFDSEDYVFNTHSTVATIGDMGETKSPSSQSCAESVDHFFSSRERDRSCLPPSPSGSNQRPTLPFSTPGLPFVGGFAFRPAVMDGLSPVSERPSEKDTNSPVATQDQPAPPFYQLLLPALKRPTMLPSLCVAKCDICVSASICPAGCNGEGAKYVVRDGKSVKASCWYCRGKGTLDNRELPAHYHRPRPNSKELRANLKPVFRDEVSPCESLESSQTYTSAYAADVSDFSPLELFRRRQCGGDVTETHKSTVGFCFDTSDACDFEDEDESCDEAPCGSKLFSARC